MSGLLGTVVDAAIGWLVQSILGSLFTGQMEAWTREIGLAEDVDKLKLEMKYVQMVLAAAKGRRIDNKPLSQSLEDLRDLLYDSEDVMDELDYYRLQQQIEQGKGCSAPTDVNPEASCMSSSTPSSAFEFIYKAASQITRPLSWALCGRKRKREEEEPGYSTMLPVEIKHDISKRINVIVDELCTIGNLVQRVLQVDTSCPIATSSGSQNTARNPRMTTSVPIESKVYGRDAERDKIIELMLINRKSSDLIVLPLVGAIGGVGKTTLARFVYRDERIVGLFDLRMWVCVSTDFSEVRLTREILEHVCEDRHEYENISNPDVLQNILLKNIRNKRFLLVLDDMWEDKDRSGWINFLAPLKSNQATGCMILATTRRKSVAKMIGTMVEVEVNGLDDKEFWLFFRACAFGDENYEGRPSLQSIGKEIAKALKGCPLAARSVGALLNTDVSYQHWTTVRDKWKSLEDADDILPILKLSYDYLPVHLQRCFSYCSLFPEDYQFKWEILVYAWISQSFVQCEDPTMRLEEAGQKYLDRLVDLGFFQKDGSCYVMHDLMHELAGTVSSNECATVHGLKHVAIRPSVRHFSIITTVFDKDEYGSLPKEKFDKILQKAGPLQKLRTFMLFGQSSIHLLGSLHTLCKKAKCLRFLRIWVAFTDMSFINSLLNLCHLRYLVCVSVVTPSVWSDGFYTNIAFPQALTRFYHLQVLNVGVQGNLVVPTDMHNLVNLRHLISHEKAHHAIACVGNMASLQELRFKVQNADSFEISQLQSMDELVQLEISQLENVKTKEEAMGARLFDKEYLEILSLSWEDNSTSLQPEAAKDVLEGLQPHHDLKSLEITGYGGATSPTWLSSTLSVTSLQILHLENCREWKILRSIEMPSLRKLTLIRMLNLMEISVPSLEELTLIDMPKLEKFIGSYGMELTSSLRVLMMKNCPQLNEFTLFQSYSSFDAQQKSWFTPLGKLSIGQCPRIMNNWPILPLREMRALKELELMDLHDVRELTVPSLEKLVLIRMPILEFCSSLTTSPPLQFLPSQGDEKEWTSNLRRLTIHDCPCLVVSHPLPPSGLITELSIRGVPTLPTMRVIERQFTIESNELSVLDDSILIFHNLRGITSFVIGHCPNLASLSSEAFSQLIALECLYIFNCPNLNKSNIMSEVLQGNSRSASSLFLPSLKKLQIVRCGVTGGWLTQMLSHSQSLEELRLTDCPQIKFLSIRQPRETVGTSSLGSAVMTSTEDEQELKLPYNLLCSLKILWIHDILDLEFCGNNRDFAGFTSLTELMLHDCPKLVSSLMGETNDDGTVEVGLLPPSLEDLSIHPLPENLQSFTPRGLVRLKKLSLSNGPCLKSVQLHSCTILKKLKITGCDQLAILEGLQYLSSFLSLKMEMNPEVSCAWDLKLLEQEQGGSQIQLFPSSLEELKIQKLTDRVQSRLLSRLPAITELKIKNSPELTSLQLGCCTALKELEIERCSSLASIEGLQFCRNLTSLKVLNSPGLGSCLELVSHQQGASGIWSGLKTLEISDASVLSTPFCKQLTSLTHLQFSYGGLVSLTEEQETALQLLTSLHELEFSWCQGLLSLPANLHRLTSLQSLSIHHCQSITRLPDMGLPHSLRRLDLGRCSEELRTQCRMAATEKLWVNIW
ncbi:probable disease resistance protein RF9 [Triticum dicoccoides]|uniref:probable disease resistance protein RF9 n=1 Tax=Triticum dicoccoides TaxID=85692 RepID=UPI000E79D3EC|nr:probable disease resistance protein RF9 [Triticum dicoccoides]XP_037449221.1 probable disease resistance protein RF9 [Triticum dicoccoides]